MLGGPGWLKIKIPEGYLLGPPELSHRSRQVSVFLSVNRQETVLRDVFLGLGGEGQTWALWIRTFFPSKDRLYRQWEPYEQIYRSSKR